MLDRYLNQPYSPDHLSLEQANAIKRVWKAEQTQEHSPSFRNSEAFSPMSVERKLRTF
jgi:hypothetical protein